ncbi:MAG: tRNA-dihydrouridine synthase family protein [Lachnospiraceae bacterium]|nr:tRNA-dihydrouridine synthase family protein [Lachnospiraceae bacterium]
MRYYFAPLEGITGYLYRNIHRKHFSGIDRYYSPFVVTRDGGIMKNKELRDILPENNKDVYLIPQILTNEAENFLQASGKMYEIGYQEVNLNLGCPSGTVTGKGRGAGFLKWENRTKLQRFLEEIFAHAKGDISIKTRIGWEDSEEFQDLLQLYNEFPICELTIHLRTRKEMYTEGVHRECFSLAYEKCKNPLCYNGDIRTVEDVRKLGQDFPELPAVMIGRGLVSDPGLVTRVLGQETGKEQLWEFYQDIFRAYQKELSGDTHLLQKMKELWLYMAPQFMGHEKYLKKIKKSHKLSEYEFAVHKLFEEQNLKES